jgi:hypothetical protein
MEKGGINMECNYLAHAPRLPTSPTGSGTSLHSIKPIPKVCTAGKQNYTPTAEESETYCNTVDFLKCPRFQASLLIAQSKQQGKSQQ